VNQVGFIYKNKHVVRTQTKMSGLTIQRGSELNTCYRLHLLQVVQVSIPQREAPPTHAAFGFHSQPLRLNVGIFITETKEATGSHTK
jgi:hypothetical protein